MKSRLTPLAQSIDTNQRQSVEQKVSDPERDFLHAAAGAIRPLKQLLDFQPFWKCGGLCWRRPEPLAS